MSQYYGVILASYWTGPTGRAIRKRGGKDAQLIGAYLFSNAHTNMIGLYKITVADIRSDLQLSTAAIEKALQVLADESFAFYDPTAPLVWVREMARIRLNILDEQPLAKADKRRIGAESLYQKAQASWLLGLFFDRYHTVLSLKTRREGRVQGGATTPLQVPPPHAAPPGVNGRVIKGFTRGFDGPWKPGSDQRSGTGTPGRSDRGTSVDRTSFDQPASSNNRKSSGDFAPRVPSSPQPDAAENIGVITKIAHEVLDVVGVPRQGTQDDLSDISEGVKSLCAQRRISYNSQVVRGAVESAIVQRGHRSH